MPAKLTTTIANIDIKVKNQVNRQIVKEFYNYLQSIDTSESYQNGLIKVLIRYTEHIGEDITFYQIQNKKWVNQSPDKIYRTYWRRYNILSDSK